MPQCAKPKCSSKSKEAAKQTQQTQQSSQESDKMKLLVFIGSARDGRMADRVLIWLKSELDKQKSEFSYDVIDPREVNFPVLKQPLQFYPDPSKAPAELLSLSQKAAEADGFILLTAEYNCQLPPGLANLLDHLPPSLYAFKPFGFVTYSMGPFAGVRIIQGLRAMAVELLGVPVNPTVSIGQIHQEITPEGKTGNTHIGSAYGKMISHLLWYCKHMKVARSAGEGPMQATEDEMKMFMAIMKK